ncbi:TIGR03016 family PEP-CTERM system-associated outer membrane protein [Roseateles sp.]|uniref:TIGR03016 family PEP-CTERM system-associated outer membrane protein n=1 Tax=Roseateles sp. TaxID=1971397 RepID=UPI003BA75BF8
MGLGSAIGSSPSADAGGVSGAGSGGAGLRVQPRVSLTQTWTDNLSLQERAKDQALISMVAPGLTVNSNSGRLRGSLDYALNGLIYTKTERANNVQHALSANASLELIDRHFFVDVRASYGQQQASAFGQQTSAENAIRNPNSSDVANLIVTPSWRGRLADFARWEAKASATETRVKNSAVGDSRQADLSLRADGIATGPLSWWSAVSSQRANASSGIDNVRSSATAGLSYRPDIEFSIGVNAGLERSDLKTGAAKSGPTAGFNAVWTPTPRTSFQGDYQRHDYGDSHSLSLNHRFQRSSIRFMDSTSVSQGLSSGAGGQLTNYQLYFFQFESLYPDPVVRDAKVRQFLQETGRSPNAQANSGFLSSSPSLQRRQELSASWQGLRASATATLNQSASSRIGGQVPGQGDLSQSSKVVQRGASASFSYRLTPDSSANLAISEQQTRGDLASQSTTLRNVNLSWNGRLGQKGSLNIGTRYSLFEGTLPYRENAVFATLVHQF